MFVVGDNDTYAKSGSARGGLSERRGQAHLFAAATLEGVCLGLLLACAQGFEEVLRRNLRVRGFSLLRRHVLSTRHVLVKMRAQGASVRWKSVRSAILGHLNCEEALGCVTDVGGRGFAGCKTYCAGHFAKLGDREIAGYDVFSQYGVALIFQIDE